MATTPDMEKITSRIRGAMFGMACGDAVGTTVEFRPPGTFPPVTDMTGGGPFHLKPGQWTDDTSMGLCLAESLIEKGKFDMCDQLTQYCNWYSHGHLSSNGRCFDIGITTRGSLNEFQSNRSNPFAGPTDERKAGNGSLMRLCAAPLAFWHSPRVAIEAAGLSSYTTHGAPQAVSACRFFAGLLVGCMNGITKDELLEPLYCPIPGFWSDDDMHKEVKRVAEGSYKRSNPPIIKGTGYVVHTMEAALWAFYHTNDFESGCLKVVNLGDDADTTAAVYGQLAGAYYCVEDIPASWMKKCALAPVIRLMADEIAAMAEFYADRVPPALLDKCVQPPTASPKDDGDDGDCGNVDGGDIGGEEVEGEAVHTEAQAKAKADGDALFSASDTYNLKKKGCYNKLEEELGVIVSSRFDPHKPGPVSLKACYEKIPAEEKDDEIFASVERIATGRRR